MIGSDYWSTAAQVMVVIALALVVEARAVVGRWTAGESRVYKSIQGLVLGAPIAAYGPALLACLDALAGRQVWDRWPVVINTSVSVGIGSVLLSPALELLVRANARIVARSVAVLTGAFLRGTTFRNRAWASRQIRSLRQQVSATDAEIDLLLAQLTEDEAAVIGAGHPECSECVARLESITGWRRQLLELRASNERYRADVEGIAHDASASLHRMKAGLRALAADVEAAIENGGPTMRDRPPLVARSAEGPDPVVAARQGRRSQERSVGAARVKGDEQASLEEPGTTSPNP